MENMTWFVIGCYNFRCAEEPKKNSGLSGNFVSPKMSNDKFFRVSVEKKIEHLSIDESLPI